MAGSTGVQTFSRISHNTRLSASAMKKESASVAARSNSGDSSSCLTGSSPRSSNESPSSGGRAKRERSPGRPESSGEGGALLKGKRRFVGVRQRPSGRWVSEIKDTTQKIRLWLGTFDTAEDAARAYDEAAWLIRGANTRTNFVVAPSKVDNSALPSKAARLLLMRRNAIAAAAAAAKAGSDEHSTAKQSPPQPKIQSLNESLLARASASAEPQRATPLSIHFHTPAAAATIPRPKSFQQQQNETYCAAPVMSTPPCSSVLSANSSYKNCRDLPGFDPNRSATHHGGARGFRSSIDLRNVKLERSPPVSLDKSGMVVERSAVDMKYRVGLSSGDNSRQEFSMGEEMCSRDVGMHRSSAGNRDGEKSYKCNDGSRENSRTNNSASAGFQGQQGATTPQDHNSSTPLGQQESFDTDISALSGLEDVDIGCVDSDFDFSAEMSMACGDHETTRINLESLFNGNTPTFSSTASGHGSGAGSSEAAATGSTGCGYEDPDTFNEQMRQMMFGRQRSAGLYAMNGVQECLMLYNNSNPAPYCMSSPSLSLPPSFAKSHLPFKNGSLMSQGWVQQPHLRQEAGQFTSNMGGNIVSMHSNMYSESGGFSSNQQSADYRTASNNVVAEQLSHGSSELSQQFTMGPEGPSPEALWNSYDLTPLCPVVT